MQERIGVRQLTILVIHFMLGTSILIAPSNLAYVAKQDGWIAAILGIALVAISVFLYEALAKRYPTLTFTAMIEVIVGKWIGKLISLLVFSYLFLLTAFLVRVAGNFITTQILPETPIEAVIVILLAVIVAAVAYGIETIARASEMLFFPVLILLVLLVLFLLPESKPENLLPMLERGPKPIILSGFYLFTLQEVAVFLMLYPNVSKPEKIRIAMLKGILVGGIAVILTTTFCLLVLGTQLTERNIFASYSLAKKISVAQFLRVDAFMAIIWLIALFFKAAISYYGASIALTETLGLRRYRVLILPLSMLVMWLSIVVYQNIVEFLNFTPAIWSLYCTCFVVVLPLLLIMIDRLRFGSKPGGQAKQGAQQQAQQSGQQGGSQSQQPENVQSQQAGVQAQPVQNAQAQQTVAQGQQQNGSEQQSAPGTQQKIGVQAEIDGRQSQTNAVQNHVPPPTTQPP
ncbi:spore germination protein KB [Paenibacillus cellulosilyticus]|uniref:Spore germination protein KB n=1 Tax=Paenibacillus cellulosilyticus TaxID=375489 RepID=A0A2V2YT00_9BACL|nr:endospore germination permease [Paenibacillus cellulosilyticus]PWW00771.1 spore germination protein KB [Paenibacillus cellulosilyticus]QKS45626.1 endospore germination permease [Paenibacillus cellulosilyticus]